ELLRSGARADHADLDAVVCRKRCRRCSSGQRGRGLQKMTSAQWHEPTIPLRHERSRRGLPMGGGGGFLGLCPVWLFLITMLPLDLWMSVEKLRRTIDESRRIRGSL